MKTSPVAKFNKQLQALKDEVIDKIAGRVMSKAGIFDFVEAGDTPIFSMDNGDGEPMQVALHKATIENGNLTFTIEQAGMIEELDWTEISALGVEDLISILDCLENHLAKV